MGKLKEQALAAAAEHGRKSDPATFPAITPRPSRFTYALAPYTVEVRDKGWYVAKSVPTFTGEKPDWSGPFETIETACLAIGRRLATEIADRHTRMVETHKLKAADPLYGLKKTTRLRQSRKDKGSVS